jgi:Mn2+/Fe2+ NRAMP family transporter
MFFIIVTTASTLGSHGITQIETATQAAEALRPLAGNFAFLLFAIGIIGTGLLAVPILAGSAAYAVAEALNWEAGLDKKFIKALGFYGVIIVATIIGVTINFSSIKPFTMLYYAAVINGIVAPPLLVLVMLISNNKRIMGKYVNSGLSNVMGWINNNYYGNSFYRPSHQPCLWGLAGYPTVLGVNKLWRKYNGMLASFMMKL